MTVPSSASAGHDNVNSLVETDTEEASPSAARTMSTRRTPVMPSSAVTVSVTDVVPTLSGTEGLSSPLDSSTLVTPPRASATSAPLWVAAMLTDAR